MQVVDEPLYKLVVLDKDGSSKINFDINGVVINLRRAPKHDPLFWTQSTYRTSSEGKDVSSSDFK